MKITNPEIDYHRNGVAGRGFYVVIFTLTEEGEDPRPMCAVVFDEPGHVAVFDRVSLGAGNITFGENSWRGDEFEPKLRDFIKIEEENL